MKHACRIHTMHRRKQKTWRKRWRDIHHWNYMRWRARRPTVILMVLPALFRIIGRIFSGKKRT